MITPYDQPAQSNIQNTYVPLPFQEIASMAEKRDQYYSQVLNSANEYSNNLANIPSANPIDANTLMGIKSNVDDLIHKTVSSGVDLADRVQQQQFMRGLKSAVPQGTIKNIMGTAAAAKAWQDELLKLGTKHDYQMDDVPGMDDGKPQYFNNWDSAKNGIWSGRPGSAVDINAVFGKVLNRLKSHSYQDPDTKLWMKGNTSTDLANLATEAAPDIMADSEGQNLLKKIHRSGDPNKLLTIDSKTKQIRPKTEAEIARDEMYAYGLSRVGGDIDNGMLAHQDRQARQHSQFDLPNQVDYQAVVARDMKNQNSEWVTGDPKVNNANYIPIKNTDGTISYLVNNHNFTYAPVNLDQAASEKKLTDLNDMVTKYQALTDQITKQQGVIDNINNTINQQSQQSVFSHSSMTGNGVGGFSKKDLDAANNYLLHLSSQKAVLGMQLAKQRGPDYKPLVDPNNAEQTTNLANKVKSINHQTIYDDLSNSGANFNWIVEPTDKISRMSSLDGDVSKNALYTYGTPKQKADVIMTAINEARARGTLDPKYKNIKKIEDIQDMIPGSNISTTTNAHGVQTKWFSLPEARYLSTKFNDQTGMTLQNHAYNELITPHRESKEQTKEENKEQYEAQQDQ